MNEILDGSSLRVSSLVGRDGVVHQATRSPIRHTSQRTLTDITRRQFWEACRDGDLEQVNYMTAWVKPVEETLSSAFKDTWVCNAGSTINTPTQSERFLQHARYYYSVSSGGLLSECAGKDGRLSQHVPMSPM